MTDKELLELAAKVWTDAGEDKCTCKECFNPLEDNEDAFKLAVDLFTVMGTYKFVRILSKYLNNNLFDGDDRYAMFRKSIVEASAEIGRRMK